MSRKLSVFLTALLATLAVIGGTPGSELYGKQKAEAVDPNDPTLRLFQVLDTSHGGKLEDFYVLADIYPDPKNPGQEMQRVLRVDYDKSRLFGRLKISVRSVAKLQPEQLKTYSAKMVYEFGVEDTEKFVKTEPGPLGKSGDLYLRSTDDRPPSTTAINDDARNTYQRLVADYLLPALQKK